MQAVTTQNASFAWSRRFKRAGGIDIVLSLLNVEGGRGLTVLWKTEAVSIRFVSVHLCCASRFRSLGRLGQAKRRVIQGVINKGGKNMKKPKIYKSRRASLPLRQLDRRACAAHPIPPPSYLFDIDFKWITACAL